MEKKMPYNKNTVINGKNINLTAQESSGAANFHKSRIAFAFLSNGQCAVNIKDQREHRVYLQEEYNLPSQEFEKLDRGYIKTAKSFFIKHHFSAKLITFLRQCLIPFCKSPNNISEPETMKYGTAYKSEKSAKNGIRL